MKKAKVMLSAVAILAVVGSVFAYKAKSTLVLYTYADPTDKTSCTVTLTGVTTTASGTLTGFVTTTVGADCQGTVIYKTTGL